MKARLTIIQMQPDKLEDGISVFRDSVAPVLKQQNGYRGAYLLTDSVAAKGISITLWDSEADMMAVEGSGTYQEQVAKFKGIAAGPPLREVYEVSIQA